MKAYHVDALILYLGQHIHYLRRLRQTSRIEREIRLWKKVQRLAKKIHRLYIL